MKFKIEHLGKWVASKDEKIIAADVTLLKLKARLKKQGKDVRELTYTLVPRGPVAG